MPFIVGMHFWDAHLFGHAFIDITQPNARRRTLLMLMSMSLLLIVVEVIKMPVQCAGKLWRSCHKSACRTQQETPCEQHKPHLIGIQLLCRLLTTSCTLRFDSAPVACRA